MEDVPPSGSSSTVTKILEMTIKKIPKKISNIFLAQQCICKPGGDFIYPRTWRTFKLFMKGQNYIVYFCTARIEKRDRAWLSLKRGLTLVKPLSAHLNSFLINKAIQGQNHIILIWLGPQGGGCSDLHVSRDCAKTALPIRPLFQQSTAIIRTRTLCKFRPNRNMEFFFSSISVFLSIVVCNCQLPFFDSS